MQGPVDFGRRTFFCVSECKFARLCLDCVAVRLYMVGIDTDPSVNISPTLPPARTRRPDERGAELVRAALDLFVSRGFAATKLEDVARAAGTSKGLPYVYFRSKEELFKAVITEAVGGPLQEADRRLDGHAGSSADMLRTLVRAFREFEESPSGGVIKLILAEAGNFPDAARFFIESFDRRGHALFERVIRRGVESGEFRAIDDPETTAIMIAQPLAMFSVWRRSLGPYEPRTPTADRYYAAYLDFVLKGLAP